MGLYSNQRERISLLSFALCNEFYGNNDWNGVKIHDDYPAPVRFNHSDKIWMVA